MVQAEGGVYPVRGPLGSPEVPVRGDMSGQVATTHPRPFDNLVEEAARGLLRVGAVFWLIAIFVLGVASLSVAVAWIPLVMARFSVVSFLVVATIWVLVIGPLMAGLYCATRVHQRGQTVRFDLAFAGFTRYGSVVAVLLITALPVGLGVFAGSWVAFRTVDAAMAAGAGSVPLFLFTLVVFVLLFSLPGIYLSLRWALALYAVFEERLDALDALRSSWRLTRGRFWPVLGVTVLAAFVSALGPGLLSIVASVWLVLAHGLLYQDARRDSPQAALPPPPMTWAEQVVIREE